MNREINSIIIPPNMSIEQISRDLDNSLKCQELYIRIDISSDQQLPILNLISDKLQSITSLVKLKIEFYEYCIIDDYQSLGNAISAFHTLNSISIIFGNVCQGGKEGITVLTRALSNLKNLEGLEFIVQENNNLSINSVKQIIDCLTSLPFLRDLSLDIHKTNSFSNPELIALCKGLQECKQIQNLGLILDFSSIDITGIKQLSNAISSFSGLLSLALSLFFRENTIENWDFLFNAIGTQVLLLSLRLEFEEPQALSEQDTDALIECIASLDILRELSIQNLTYLQQIQQNLQIIKSLSASENLNYLELKIENFNELSTEEIEGLTCTFNKLQKLERLYLTMTDAMSLPNQLLTKIVSCFTNMNELNVLSLDLNILLTHEDCYFFSQQLRYLIHLDRLIINFGFQWNQEAFYVFCQSLLSCKQLQVLMLKQTERSPQNIQMQYFIDCLQQLPELTTFCFDVPLLSSIVQISNESSNFLNNKKLDSIKLYLSGGFQDLFISNISSVFKNTPYLTALDLQISTSMKNEAYFDLIQGISHLNRLISLKIMTTFPVSSKMAQLMNETFLQLRELEEISLLLFRCTILDFTKIMEGLNKSLYVLDLHIMNFCKNDDLDNPENLSNIFRSLKSISKITITCNNLDNQNYDDDFVDCYEIFFSGMQNLSTLLTLEFIAGHNINGISQKGFKAISKFFENSQSLLNLRLNICKATTGTNITEGIELIRQSIKYLKKLSNFYFTVPSQYCQEYLSLQRQLNLLDNLKILELIYTEDNIDEQVEQSEIISKNQNYNQQSQVVEVNHQKYPKYFSKLMIDIALSSNQEDVIWDNLIISSFDFVKDLRNLLQLDIKLKGIHQLNMNGIIYNLGNSLQSIGLLESIKLDLKGQFSEESAIQLSQGISQQRYLILFSLTLNDNLPMTPSPIFEGIRNLKKLNVLGLFLETKVTNEQYCLLGKSLWNLSNLEEFYFVKENEDDTDQEIQNIDTGIDSIGVSLYNTPKLKLLKIVIKENTILGKRGLASLSIGLSNLKHIQWLEISVSNCKNEVILDEGLYNIANSLEVMKKLTTLRINIYYAGLETQDLMNKFTKSISNHTNLKLIEIDVRTNDKVTLNPFYIMKKLNSRTEQTIELLYDHCNKIKLVLNSSDLHLKLTYRSCTKEVSCLVFDSLTQLPLNYTVQLTLKVQYDVFQRMNISLENKIFQIISKIQLNHLTVVQKKKSIVNSNQNLMTNLIYNISSLKSLKNITLLFNYVDNLEEQIIAFLQKLKENKNIQYLKILIYNNHIYKNSKSLIKERTLLQQLITFEIVFNIQTYGCINVWYTKQMFKKNIRLVVCNIY